MTGRRIRAVAVLGSALGMLWGAAPALGAAGSDEACLKCHGDPGLRTTRDGRAISLYVEARVGDGSVHAGIACADCHADIGEIPHEKRLPRVACRGCHRPAAEEYGQSIHGLRGAQGDVDVPGCAACHGTHDIQNVKGDQLRAFRAALVQICTACHIDEEMTSRHPLPKPEMIRAYAASAHGRGLVEKGLNVTAVCVDCHGAHTIEPADDSRSLVHRSNIPALCGRCHAGIAATYLESIHGRAAAAGIPEAPMCTDCHGEHTIAAAADPASSVAPRNIPKTCATCHEEERIATKYGLPMRRFATYLDSYHGVVNRYGEAVVANCASCHGVHDIRPSSDPASSIHPANLGKTCGACHPGAEAGLTNVRMHVEAVPESSKGMYYVRMFYTYFIGGLMVCFVGYMAVETYGFLRRRRRR